MPATVCSSCGRGSWRVAVSHGTLCVRGNHVNNCVTGIVGHESGEAALSLRIARTMPKTLKDVSLVRWGQLERRHTELQKAFDLLSLPPIEQ